MIFSLIVKNIQWIPAVAKNSLGVLLDLGISVTRVVTTLAQFLLVLLPFAFWWFIDLYTIIARRGNNFCDAFAEWLPATVEEIRPWPRKTNQEMTNPVGGDDD